MNIHQSVQLLMKKGYWQNNRNYLNKKEQKVANETRLGMRKSVQDKGRAAGCGG